MPALPFTTPAEAERAARAALPDGDAHWDGDPATLRELAARVDATPAGGIARRQRLRGLAEAVRDRARDIDGQLRPGETLPEHRTASLEAATRALAVAHGAHKLGDRERAADYAERAILHLAEYTDHSAIYDDLSEFRAQHRAGRS